MDFLILSLTTRPNLLLILLNYLGMLLNFPHSHPCPVQLMMAVFLPFWSCDTSIRLSLHPVGWTQCLADAVLAGPCLTSDPTRKVPHISPSSVMFKVPFIGFGCPLTSPRLIF